MAEKKAPAAEPKFLEIKAANPAIEIFTSKKRYKGPLLVKYMVDGKEKTETVGNEKFSKMVPVDIAKNFKPDLFVSAK